VLDHRSIRNIVEDQIKRYNSEIEKDYIEQEVDKGLFYYLNNS
jgi:hypothetical protein